jgi:hypothetical protein
MANPDLAFGALQKGVPSVVARHQRRKDAAKALADAYRDVDVRDGGVCWVTGRYTQSGAPDARVRREHHHLKGRNVKPEWVDRPERIITVAKDAHDLITSGWIVVEGVDARKAIRFHWRSDIKAHQKPFQIKGRRS